MSMYSKCTTGAYNQILLIMSGLQKNNSLFLQIRKQPRHRRGALAKPVELLLPKMYIRNLLLTAMAMCAFGMMVACNPSPQDKQPTDSPVFGITEDDAEIYVFAEHEPEFPGGIDSLFYFLNRNIRYPEEAIKRKIEGKIYTRFIVEKDGSITNAEIIRDIVYGNEEADSLAARLGCGAEVIRVINMMPKWKPASTCGTSVRYQFILPVMFSLSEGIINPLSM